MKKTLTFFLVFIFCTKLFGQKEWSNWYQSGYHLLTFKNGYPELVQGFINPLPQPTDFLNFQWWAQMSGSVSYSDPVTGEMKFIISNRLGFGADYKSFPNSTFIRSCPGDIFSYHIIPFHNNPNKFYVIQFQDCGADVLAQETGLQVRCPNAIGLGYSIVDLTMNGGLGDFSLVNQPITSNLSQQMTTVRHANGKDVWTIVHPYGTGNFSAILVTDNGINPGVISTIGPVVKGSFANTIGTLTASHDGKLLAGFTPTDDGIQLFDFDNATGKLSNYRKLPFIFIAYSGGAPKLQFSPDNSKLYALGNEQLYQYDLNQTDIGASLTKIYGGENSSSFTNMQLAQDGKIYVCKTNGFDVNNNYYSHTGIIQCPNLPQYACNFNPKGFDAVGSYPDLINDFIQDPKAPLITKFDLGNDASICFGTYTITAPDGWESYKWNTGETTKSITISKPGTYFVLTGNTGFSCPSGYGYINITDKAIKLNLGRDTTLCPGKPYTLHVDNNYSNILWENGSTVRDSIITTNKLYIISADDKNGCGTKDSIRISFKTEPTANFGKDTTLCNNQPITLLLYPQSNVFTSGVYKWQDGSLNDKFTITKSGVYWGSVSYQGCVASDTIRVDYLSAGNVSIGNDTTLCAGDTLVLSSKIDNATYLWSTGETAKTINVKTSGTYSVKVSTAICTQSDTIKVTFNSGQVFSLGNDTAVCGNNKLVLNPNPGIGNYLWQDGSTAAKYTVQSPGWYWLKFTSNGCSTTDSININYKTLPVINLGKDTGICKGASMLLNAAHPNSISYLWQDQDMHDSYLANKEGFYSVSVLGSNGCFNSDTIHIAVTNPPAFSLGSDTTICESDLRTFNFNLPNASYLWNDGSTKNNYTIRNSGTYTLSVSQNGCSSSDTVRVAYKPQPQVNLGKDTLSCLGNTIILNAGNAGSSYTWQNNSSLSTFAVTKTGIYSVTADLNGCKKSDTISVIFKNKPLFTLGNDLVLCMGQEHLLKPDIEYPGKNLWQNGSTQSQFLVKDSGIYSLTVTNECGVTTNTIKISTVICKLNMPNAFSPNGDGNNDVFRIKYPFKTKQFIFTIYGRWGQKVFETTDMKIGWDGTYHGILQPQEHYVWTISLVDSEGKKQDAHGTVLLIR